MKKTNKCTKYQTDVHENISKTMKSPTTNKNDALSNKTSQMNKVTYCIVSTTSTQTIINLDHPLVKLGYVIFEMSGDLKKNYLNVMKALENLLHYSIIKNHQTEIFWDQMTRRDYIIKLIM